MSLNLVMPIYTSQAGITQAQRTFEKATQSIATGLNANISPADVYVSEKLDTSIRSAQIASENAQTGYNLTAVADSALVNISNNLQRIRELSLQASNGYYSDEQRSAIQAEIDQNVEQIEQTLSNATFNGKQVLNAVTQENPNPAPAMTFMVNPDSSTPVTYDPNVVIGNLTFDVSSPEAAATSAAQVDSLLSDVSSQRASIATAQTSFEDALNQLSAGMMADSASLSQIQDTDYLSALTDIKKAQYSIELMTKVMKTVMNSEQYVLKLLQ